MSGGISQVLAHLKCIAYTVGVIRCIIVAHDLLGRGVVGDCVVFATTRVVKF